MPQYLISLIFFLCCVISHAQNSVNVALKNSTLIATDNTLPFWFTANHHGKIIPDNAILNISDINIQQNYNHLTNNSLAYTWGANLVCAFGEKNYYQVNQAFVGILFKGWELKGGMFCDKSNYAGLSTTNGIIARSENARPCPALRLSTPDYKPVPLLRNRLRFKAEYDEGILNDNRYVEKPHLHHKSFYLLVEPTPTWEIHGGVEHFVIWGGTSPVEELGKQPDDFKSYWLYVLGKSGNENFTLSDQKNIAGDQFGTYQLKIVKYFSNLDATFYLSHPFEDLSGVNWRNWPDNLLGVHISYKDKNQFVTDIVYEFTNTRQQSIRDSLYELNETTGEWERQDHDPYYTHGLYRSGYTYHQFVMCSPLFFPVIKSDDIVTGIRSLRFFSHHVGLCGILSKFLNWKSRLTYTHHLGTYSYPYETTHNQFSGQLTVEYNNPGFPVELGISTAADAGNAIKNNYGVQLWIAKHF